MYIKYIGFHRSLNSLDTFNRRDEALFVYTKSDEGVLEISSTLFYWDS